MRRGLAVLSTLILAIIARGQTLPAGLPQRFECAIPKEQQPGYTIDLPTYRRKHVPDGSIEAVCLARLEREGQQHSAAGREACKRAVETYSRVMRHEFTLPEHAVERSAANFGDRRRLRAFVRKLLAGEPTSVVGIGGSIMNGAGAVDNDKSFMNVLFAWLRAAFPGSPLTLSNKAHGATTSAFYADCLLREAAPPDSTDLVLVEFLVNDRMGLDGESAWISYEAIYRTLLSYERPPAVLPLHLFSYYVSAGGYLETNEDIVARLSKYYALPSLSLRSAIWDEYRRDVRGFKYDEVWCDIVHPSKLGHAYVADMLIGLLQDILFEELVGANGVPPAADGLTAQMPPADLVPLPPALSGGGADSMVSRVCLHREGLQAAVLSHDGWQWTDEGRGKWGYVATAPGAALQLAVDTRCGGLDPSQRVTLGVGNLKSYNLMGVAQVECVEGCQCAPVQLDGIWRAQTSQAHLDPVLVSQAERCVVRVTVTDRTSSGEHKFKLTSLSVRCTDRMMAGIL